MKIVPTTMENTKARVANNWNDCILVAIRTKDHQQRAQIYAPVL
jgi:hypothetical protein